MKESSRVWVQIMREIDTIYSGKNLTLSSSLACIIAYVPRVNNDLSGIWLHWALMTITARYRISLLLKLKVISNTFFLLFAIENIFNSMIMQNGRYSSIKLLHTKKRSETTNVNVLGFWQIWSKAHCLYLMGASVTGTSRVRLFGLYGSQRPAWETSWP